MENNVPPIIAQYITNAFDSTLREHVRRNYRDNLDKIIEVCQAAIKEFDKKELHNRTFTRAKK